MTVSADQLVGGDGLYAETLQGKETLVRVHGVLIQDWSTTRSKVTVFTRDADFEYRGDELLQVERGA